MERSTSNLKHLILYHTILNNFVWPGLHFSPIVALGLANMKPFTTSLASPLISELLHMSCLAKDLHFSEIYVKNNSTECKNSTLKVLQWNLF